MNVHEYQAKELFREFGVAVPEGARDDARRGRERARSARHAVVVVKAQVHAGGRGKGGGVKLAKTAAEAKTAASEILGMTLHTPQTPPEGKLVRKVYVEAGSNIERELYLAILFDRAEEKFAIVASTEGGMEIEDRRGEDAREDPDDARRPERRPPRLSGPRPRLSARARRRSGQEVRALRAGLFELFVEKDCSQVEINPLVVTQRAISSRSTASSTSTTTRSIATRRSRSCAIPRRRTSASARPTRSISPTSGSTATSAAW